MIRLYYTPDYPQKKIEGPFADLETENLIWIDVQHPSKEELLAVEGFFNIRFPSEKDQQEIEMSSRYTEEDDAIRINSTFLVPGLEKGQMEQNAVTFIISDHYLFSLRYFNSKTMAETVKKVRHNSKFYKNPANILITIIGIRIDLDADLIESLSKDIAALGTRINTSKELDEKIILRINSYQEQIMELREILFDKQRVVSSLNRNAKVYKDNSKLLRILLKDIDSLIEHTNFNFTRLEYMQNNFIGLVNIEQNKIIKIFTVASVVFMPPTLIASLYGMNFRIMPELEWSLGYPFAIFIMVASSVITLLFFKKKKWL